MSVLLRRFPQTSICFAAAILFLTGIFLAGSFTSTGGELQLDVVFPANPAAPSEPLVVAGEFGAADFLIVQYPDPGTIRLRYDTWGTNGTPLPDLQVSRSQPHRMRVRMPALHTPRNVLRPGAEPVDELVIELDERELTRTKVRGNSVRPDQIYIGSNPVGGTTCSLSFSGQIVRAFDGASSGSISALLAGHPVLVTVYLCVCVLAAFAIVCMMTPSEARSAFIRTCAPTGVAVAACAVALLMLADPSGGFYADWFIHVWFVSYHGLFLGHHLGFPEVMHTQQAIGMIDPAFYGRLPYSVIGVASSIIGPDLAVRAAFFLVLLLQFVEIRQLMRMLGAGDWLANTAAALACWSIYPLTNLLQRSSVLEFTATCFLTAAICRLLRWPLEDGAVAFRRSVLAFTVFIAIAMLTHPITAMMGCLFCGGLWMGVAVGAERRARIFVAGLCAATGAAAIASPWLYMIARFQPQLRISTPVRGLTLYPFDQLWVRFYPVAFDPRTTADNIRTVSTPYLDAQINTAMLALAAMLLGAAWIRRHAHADRIQRRFRIATGCTGAILFIAALAYSVSPELALHVSPPLNMMQFGVRLVTYCNLGIIVLLAAVAGGGFPKRQVRIACCVLLAWSFAGLCVKYAHVAAVMNHRSAWRTEAEVLELPEWFYGLGDFSTTRDLPAPDPALPVVKAKFAVAGGSRFGEVAGDQRFTSSTPAVVSTNVVAFPWNRLALDGAVVPRERLRHDGAFYAVLADAGEHTLRYEFAPDGKLSWLRGVSNLLLAAALIALGALSRRAVQA